MKNQQRAAKRKKRNQHSGLIVQFFKYPQEDFFFLGSTTSSKRKRKFRSHDTEIRKQERKLNHTDSEKAEAVTRRLLTVLVHT